MRLRSNISNPASGFIAVLAIALSHIGVLAFASHPEVPSDLLQIASALLALGFCINHAFRNRDRYLRYTWLQLGTAFALWSSAQCIFFYFVVTKQPQPPFPSTASVLYFLVAFPILMVTVVRRSSSRWEWVNWLDSAQACNFFFVLDALVFSHPSLIPITTAYDVQALALVLAGALRYTSAAPGAERAFFRNLFAFLFTYGVLVCFGIHLEIDLHIASPWMDLCWSAPFLLFCTLFAAGELWPASSRKQHVANLPRHLHGLSALGITVLSIAAGGVLELHRPFAGIAALSAAFLLFALRTTTREHQLHRAHDSLQHSALHDALTGLANRSRLRRELESRLRTGGSQPGSIAMLFIDLDRFKTINDGLGHAFGDRLLVAIAQILCSAVRAGDLVARLGGDEFVILAECSGLAQAQALADGIVQQLRQPLKLEGRVLHVTASAGIVFAEAGMRPEELLRNADCAMYAAKDRGRNQATLFEPSMGEKANGALRLETDLRDALACGGISIQYQPIYSLAEQAVTGFEALARWQHGTRGFISPADFIPVAEDSGLILELGEQVLRAACRQVFEWNSTFGRDFYVSVNVSARQFSDEKLLGRIQAALAETGLPPHRLKLEVTESVLLSGIQPVEQVLNAVRAMGVQVALDDFGTGYSSLSYLLRFPFDVIKMDRSFVQSLDQNPQRADLAGAIMQIATNLGKQVIAEGVETENELHCLRQMRCNLLQGYLFSKPLPADSVTRALDQSRNPIDMLESRSRPIWAPPALAGDFREGFARTTRIALPRPSLPAKSQPAYFSPN